jgi:hypothetical protein
MAATAVEPVPAVTLEEIFSPPVEGSSPAELSPAEAPLFVDESDVSDVTFTICCRGALAVCVASCGGDVDSFTCTKVGSGCTSSCDC